MNAMISLDYLLHALSGLSLSNRQWLADHLVEPWEHNQEKAQIADEEFVRQFLATPYDNPMTADEAKQMIRESHQFGFRTIKPLHDGE